MRLAERNNLRENEVYQVSRYLDGLKPQIRDRIRVQVVKSMTEAKNLAMKAEIEGNRRTYGNDNFQRSNSGEETSRSFVDRSKAAQGWNQVCFEESGGRSIRFRAFPTLNGGRSIRFRAFPYFKVKNNTFDFLQSRNSSKRRIV
ncbi:hypothetical protein M9H77_20543 [Catharanthus roseus]|uniref:Uncharacterized protein n=1 Tax=Catharanthus roseus TaxID=4058 RepID=A0ACC0ALS4_CATRO|nr:hypothetical protein M9H77_20543 [Catharanthus roseus]